MEEMKARPRPALPPKPLELPALRSSIPQQAPIRRTSSDAPVKPIAPRTRKGSSDGELEQMRLSRPQEGLTAPVLPSTIIRASDEYTTSTINGVAHRKLDRGNKTEKNKIVSETKNIQPRPAKSSFSSAKQGSSAIKHISIQSKFSANSQISYKAMDSTERTGLDLPLKRKGSTLNTPLSIKKSVPTRIGYDKTPHKTPVTGSKSSPLDTTLNTTPRIISATLKNGQKIIFASPTRTPDTRNDSPRESHSPSSLDSPRSRGSRVNAQRLLIKTPLPTADDQNLTPPCPFSPTDKTEINFKSLEKKQLCGASSEKNLGKDSAHSNHDQQIQELDSFVSLATSTPNGRPSPPKNTLQHESDDESEEVILRNIPQRSSGDSTPSVKRASSILGPINKMRDSLKKAISNSCTSGGLHPSVSWEKIPEPSPERETQSLSVPASENSSPVITQFELNCREVQHSPKQNFPSSLASFNSTAPLETNSPGRLGRLWNAFIDRVRKGWERLLQSFVKLYKHQKN